ncbi:MAG: 23S rRNA (adenine(2503)-C(2))-methyltransferase RlmN [Verrucomicrobiota bacterium]
MKTAISTLSQSELAQWLIHNGQPKFRAGQIREWLDRKWVSDFADMRNIPSKLRSELAEAFRCSAVAPLENRTAEDGTTKYLLKLRDNHTIETVLIPAPGRTTVCISSQVGCPVRCAFCASGRTGLTRNLDAAEIIDQIRFACRTLDQRVDNVVVMGIGEPLLNLDALLPALEALCSADRIGLSARRVTISTSGIVPGIYRLAAAGHPWNLAVSLHSPRDRGRAALIPPQYRYPLRDILAACQTYETKTNRMVTLEYALMANTNDSIDDAKDLSNIALRLHAKVNLIPHNPVGSSHAPPANATTHAFLAILTENGIQATIRREKGALVNAACGQLRANSQIPD